MPASVLNPGVGTNCGLTTNCGSIGGPYWDNLSGDGPQMNAGYFLTATGAFTGDADYDPTEFLAGSGSPDDPTSIILDNTGGLVTASLLANYTGNTYSTFGVYNTSSMAETPLVGPGNVQGDIGDTLGLSLTDGENYGFYLTTCLTWVSGVGSACTSTQTWFSNEALDTTDEDHQHFALFTSATPGVYYIGAVDWYNGGVEGSGDYNDFIFELDTNATVPEPASLGLMGAGLLGLGLARFRKRRA
jgi:hypothetical protein